MLNRLKTNLPLALTALITGCLFPIRIATAKNWPWMLAVAAVGAAVLVTTSALIAALMNRPNASGRIARRFASWLDAE